MSEGVGPIDEGPTERMRVNGGAIGAVVGVVLLVVFMLQNTNDARLDFLFWGFTWPVWLLTLVSAAVGAAVWFGLGVRRRRHRRKERRDERRD